MRAVMTTTARTIEPQTQEFLDMLANAGGPPIYTLSPTDARAVLRSVQARPVSIAPAGVEARTIDGGATGPVAVRIVRPTNVTEAPPVVLYIHGGGWVLGDFDTHARLVHQLAFMAKVAVVFVEYTPSPEARFPTAIEQCYAALQWVAAHGVEAGLDGSRLAIAGDSVGGNMSAAVTMLAKRRGGPRLRTQVLFYPVTDAGMATPSYGQFADGPWLTRAAMAWFWDQYLPDAERRADPLVSPLLAGDDDLRGLPPALVITSANDVLRDEGEAYAARLSWAGVPTVSARYLGTIHDFVMLNPIADVPAAQAAIAQAADTLRGALG